MSHTTARKAARRRAVRLQRMLLGSLLILFGCMTVFILTLRKTPEDRPAAASSLPDRGSGGAEQALPAGWAWKELPQAALSAGTLALVNADHAFDPALPELVRVYENKTESYLVKDVYLSLEPEAMAALNAWMDAFAAETGVTDVNVIAGWRSYDDQVAIYDSAVAEKGQAHADAYIALPGHSEHHTGLAVDLDTYDVSSGLSGGFDGNGVYAWAVEHAWEYGFVQRYPPSKRDVTGISYESWHFRYVGLPHADIMASKNLCLEEYIDYLRGFPFDGEHLTVTCQGAAYEIYFCESGSVAVPTDRAYTVCGNNADGFIVTVCG